MAADWTNIPNTSLEPDAPARSIDALALRDNPIAIAEGAAGAPSVLPNIASRSQAGALGTYALLGRIIANVLYAAPGDIKPGSELFYAGVFSKLGAAASGSWRCMGIMDRSSSSGDGLASTLWVRIA